MSRTIGVATAIDELATAFGRLEAEGTHASRAYFFMVGAGISTPQVKLAGAIEEECRAVAPSAVPPPDVAGSPMLRYSFWLEHAHPNRVQRQRYFRQMIENRAISAANFRLAHAITSGHAPRLVVTTNFDDFLTRSLILFGAQPIVSDHPESAIRIDPESDDIQILHLHGTYWFYDCCNLDGEIATRAQMGAPHQNVSWRLGQILDRRSPIVLGYSGWEGDVFMTCLRARLDAPGGLPYNLYWFCYRRDARDALPRWLVDHPDVCLVVPEAPATSTGTGGDPGPAGEHPRDDQSATEQPQPVETRADEPRLEASTVLDRLNPALGLDEPALTRNPIGFFADHLRRSLVSDGDEGGDGDDPYRLRWTIEQLSAMRGTWPSASDTPRDDADPDALLARVQSAVRRSRHREAIAIARAIALEGLTSSQLAELRKTVMLASVGLLDDSDDELAGYDLVVAAGDLAGEEVDLDELSRALLYRGLTLEQLERTEEALAAYEQLIARCEEPPDRFVAQRIAVAMRHKGNTLATLDRDDEALAAYDRMIERFATDPEPDLRHEVAETMAAKAHRLGTTGRRQEALALYTELVERYGDDADAETEALIAHAMGSVAYMLALLDRGDEAVAAYDRLIERFESHQRTEIQRVVAMALRSKGYTLGELGRGEEALASYDALLERFGDSADQRIRREVATAMVNKGFCLGELGRSEDAIATYDELIERAGEDADGQIRLRVAQAMYNKARRYETVGRRDDAVATRDALVERFKDAGDPELADVVARAREERPQLDD